jgi:hypothetical protein
MSHRLLEEQEARRDAAIDIAIRAKVLRVCEFHGDVLMGGSAEPEHAYRVGNAKFTAGELEGIFKSRPEMTDSIKAAIDEIALDDCPRCAKMRED